MRLPETKIPRECPSCKKHSIMAVQPEEVRVFNTTMPSKCSVGVCQECGKIAYLPKLAEIYIMDVLKKKGQMGKLENGVEQIIEEANKFKK